MAKLFALIKHRLKGFYIDVSASKLLCKSSHELLQYSLSLCQIESIWEIGTYNFNDL